MTQFDIIYNQTTKAMYEPQLESVLTKEIFHHDILRILMEKDYLRHMTFVGGTCLRLCYGSNRLSEDLDFTAGPHFKVESFSQLPTDLKQGLEDKFGLEVNITPPKVGKQGNVEQWKVRIKTAPEKKEIPQQHITLDVSLSDSLTRENKLLMNHFGIDLGSFGVIVPAQSKEEILADKLVAFGNRDKIKNRDLWDIFWIQKSKAPSPEVYKMAANKLRESNLDSNSFHDILKSRLSDLEKIPPFQEAFEKEMIRFLPRSVFEKSAALPQFWPIVTLSLKSLIDEFCSLN